MKKDSILKAVLVSLLFAGILPATAQKENKNYLQEISGTSLGFEMVAIPGGSFNMGSPEDEPGRSDDESPRHQVKISPFWMSSHEITWDVFEPFVYRDHEDRVSTAPVTQEVDAIARPTKPYLDMTFGMGKNGHPAVGMTQYGAIQFCKWLYARTGIFYRLPTEAEWEYACRAGSSEAYSNGDESDLKDIAWYAENSGGETHPVGQKKPNDWGLYDMHGNVAEWTMDQYLPDFYEESEGATDPLAQPEDLYPRVLRGGSFDSTPDQLRCASRLPSDPAWKQIDPQIPKSNWWFPEAPFVGVRLVRPVDPPSKEEIEAYYNAEPILDY